MFGDFIGGLEKDLWYVLWQKHNVNPTQISSFQDHEGDSFES